MGSTEKAMKELRCKYHYRVAARGGPGSCRLCKHYDGTDESCALIRGIVSSCALCDLFVKLAGNLPVNAVPFPRRSPRVPQVLPQNT